jgi:cell shape-determining protein MreC
MKKNLLLTVLICMNMLSWKVSRAQQGETVVDKIINFPTSFFNKVKNKYSSLEDRLTKQTEKYLQRLAKKEKKMKRKLAKTDSAKAEQTFGDIDGQYNKMIAAINQDSLPVKRGSGAYMPMVDSVKTSLAFL